MIAKKLVFLHARSLFRTAAIHTLDKDELSNYRPISNLSLISKLIERVVKSRLSDHLTSNNLSSCGGAALQQPRLCRALFFELLVGRFGFCSERFITR